MLDAKKSRSEGNNPQGQVPDSGALEVASRRRIQQQTRRRCSLHPWKVSDAAWRVAPVLGLENLRMRRAAATL
jgi:hypothetical protein